MVNQVRFYFRKDITAPYIQKGGLFQYGIEVLFKTHRDKSLDEIISRMFDFYKHEPDLFKYEIACDFHNVVLGFENEIDAPVLEIQPLGIKGKLKKLTKRQLGVLELMQKGVSIKEISQKFSISESTVKGHQQKIFDVFGIHKTTTLILMLKNSGL